MESADFPAFISGKPLPHLTVSEFVIGRTAISSKRPHKHALPPLRRVSPTCMDADETEPRKEDNPEGKPRFKHRFDPESETDAFGRDPKKETEFWMGAAKSVLESEEVKKAIADHAAEGGDGYTDEQRAYMEFIKSLDEKSTDDK